MMENTEVTASAFNFNYQHVLQVKHELSLVSLIAFEKFNHG